MVPVRLPPSPHAQRTLAATLSSLSAHYAQTGRLDDAKDVQERGADLLLKAAHARSDDETLERTGSSVASPAKALHDLFLLHRTSLLSLHHAEVSYALRSSSSSSPSSSSATSFSLSEPSAMPRLPDISQT